MTFVPTLAIHPIKPVFMTRRARTLAVLDIGSTVSYNAVCSLVMDVTIIKCMFLYSFCLPRSDYQAELAWVSCSINDASETDP